MAKIFSGLSYENVVRKYAQTVTVICVVRLQNKADAEDCFQNTFIKLLTKAPEFKDETHLKRWLIRVAINECNIFIRKNRQNLSLDALNTESYTKSNDELDISWALMRLENEYRDILYLYYCEQYKIKEIAEILNMNANTVKARLMRGRKKLKKIYGGDER